MLPHVRHRLCILDGYNVAFALPEFRPAQRASPTSAGARLAVRAGALVPLQFDEVVVVLDGRGAGTVEEASPTAARLVFAPAGETADTVIERLVAHHAPAAAVTVVTADAAQRSTVEALGGVTAPPADFAAWLERAAERAARAARAASSRGPLGSLGDFLR